MQNQPPIRNILPFAVGIGLLLTGSTAFLSPDTPWVWRVLGILTLGLFGFWIFQDRASVQTSLSKKTTRYGLNSVFLAVLGLVLAIFVNLIAKEYNFKKDITKQKLHSLSDQSQKVLKGLKREVVLKAFVNPTQQHEFDYVFDKYTYQNKNVRREFIDPDKDPLAVKEYKIKSLGTVIVQSGDRTVNVESLNPEDPKIEEKLTNAIISVVKGEKKKLYFLSGHGERLLTDSGREGFSAMKEGLEGGRFTVEELVLIQKGKVPEDADLVLAVGPKSEFLEQETKILKTYLAQGGKMMVLLEPNSTASLKGFLRQYHVDWHQGEAVLERNQVQQLAGGNPLVPIVFTYDKGHEITREANQPTIFPFATPVLKAEGENKENYQVAELLKTSPGSLQVALKGNKVYVDEKTAKRGPFPLALAISAVTKGKAPAAEEKKDAEGEGKAKDPEMRLVIVGSVAFASNQFRQFGINSDLFQNMVSWLAKEEDMISIRPRPTDSSQFEITLQRSRVIFFASVLFAPLVMFLSGFGVWLSRKNA